MKVTIIVNETLPPGLAANCAAVLGITLGARHGGIVGRDTTDRSGTRYVGITTVAVPILKASVEQLGDIARAARRDPTLLHVLFSEVARTSRTYDEYEERLVERETGDVGIVGLCLAGDNGTIRTLTGSLPLL